MRTKKAEGKQRVGNQMAGVSEVNKMPFDKFVGEYPKKKKAPATKVYEIGNVGVFKDRKGKTRNLF